MNQIAVVCDLTPRSGQREATCHWVPDMTAEMDKELLRSLGMPGLKVSGNPKAVQKWQYYVLLGCFVQGWATLEYIFDLCIRAIFENTPGGHKLIKKLPLALGGKIRFFKDAHEKIDALKENLETAQSIANVMETIGKFRHLVFHSAQGFTDDQNIRDLRRMVLRDNKNVETRVNISAEQIAEGLRLIVRMIHPMIKYAEALIATFPTARSGGSAMGEPRKLRLLATEYWRPYTCKVKIYLQEDHASGQPHLIARYGEGYSGPRDLPIVDGMPEFATVLPQGLTDQQIIDEFIAPDLSRSTKGTA